MALRTSTPRWAAVIIVSALVSGCSTGDYLKGTLLGKSAPEPDIPERPPLVIPKTADLPPPGQPSQTAANTDQAKKQTSN